MEDTDLIVLLDDDGKPIGTAPKLASHHADTPLHLGFSCYVFNDQGQLLLTQRAHSKKVWPDVWTNTTCGHPAPEESMVDAITRRLDYELGMTEDDFRLVLPDYRYKTPEYNGVVENEICPVYVAHATSEPRPNPAEVEACKWVAWEEFVRQAEADSGNIYSYWCKDQLKQLKDHPLIPQYSKS